MGANYEINHSPSNKRLTTELMTQEQANAIAERVAHLMTAPNPNK